MNKELTPLPDLAQVETEMRRWLERAVIGLNLCPFARAPYLQGRVRLRVTAARSEASLLDDLLDELERLRDAEPEDCETTLLVHPGVLTDFLDFNDFLDVAEGAVEDLELEGVIQVASFHPQYAFADSAPDDPANLTNRAPYPCLHLLREASIERVIEALDDPDAIYERNIENLRRLGWTGWQQLWVKPEPSGEA